MSEIVPNDRQGFTDLDSRRASGISRRLLTSRGVLASVAFGAVALGLAVAARYRRRDTFENKVVVITGSSRGLGLALARDLASRGASLGLMARDAIELARARRTIDSDSLVQLLPADVTNPAQVEQAFSMMLRRFGRIDVVINVDSWGALNVSRAALPHLARHGSGRIINVCPSTYAQSGVSATMAEELRETGIRVTTVLPGTSMSVLRRRIARAS